ncbi:PQQ-like beta-propeller repeat protein, partial [bacterium]|nr:PQQ-like beta-propeller repeat protein [bacterium]
YQSEPNFNYSSASIGADGIVYVGSGNDLLAIKPDGNLLWKYRVGEEVASSPAIALDGTIYVRGRSDYLCAINKDGTPKWRLHLGISYHAGIGVSSPAIGDNGTVYTPGMVEGSGLYAINPDGSIKWVYPDSEVSNNNKTPAVASDGTIYIASTHKLIAVDSDGNLKWTFDLNWFSNSSPAIDNNGTTYIGTWDHYFYAINPDGTLKWSFETLNNIDSSPAIGSDGTIYFGSWDGYLYAVGSESDEDWETAYNILFDNSSDLVLLRQYRDKVLSKTTKGRIYKTLLYMSSEKALEVFLDNSKLMLKAKDLIEANKDAVSEVLNGNEGVIYSTDEIVSFVDAYAKKSPPALKILANMVKREMLIKQRQGDLFLGFKLK